VRDGIFIQMVMGVSYAPFPDQADNPPNNNVGVYSANGKFFLDLNAVDLDGDIVSYDV
jgi:hypothetical protein